MKVGNQSCKYLGVKHPKLKKQHVQRSCGGSDLSLFKEEQEGWCGWSRTVVGNEAGEMPGQTSLMEMSEFYSKLGSYWKVLSR